MIVATAGHIDHGKTSLIRALTGVETDRLREERERGISIDLGFAWWDRAPGLRIGFVDVPGHERFVRNMLAGVSGIDCALLVVAADDGPMPQTVEHLRILDLLAVRCGVVAITKCDRVAPARVAEVSAQVASLLAGTALADAPRLAVSAVTGAGLDALGAALEAASAAPARMRPADRVFRMAVDRVFSLAGLGTIAAGCVHDGEARVGERLAVMPSGRAARLRAIQSGGIDVDAARAGQRCALALAGVETRDLARGDWLVGEGFPGPVAELHARVGVLPGEPRALPDLARLHLHVGTCATIVRVRTASRRPIEPGGSAICRLQFERPVSALNGDRFILRDPSATRTLGGGRVLAASTGARDAAWTADTIPLLESHDLGTVLDGLLARPAGELDLDRLQQAFGVTRDALLRRAAERGAVPVGADARVAVSGAVLDALKARLIERLAAFHLADPEAAGPSPLQLAVEAGGPCSRAVFAHALRSLGDEGALRWRGPTVALPGHVPPVRRRDAELWERVLPRLAESTVSPPSVRVLAADSGVAADELAALLHRKCRDGEAWKVTDARFYPRASTAALAATAAEVAAAQPDGWFRVAHYRDRIGTGRGLAIEILEFFDRVGVTLRRGDLRRLRPGYELVLGAGAPIRERSTKGGRDA